ncbi:MAG: hypothetical protein V1908_04370 [Candidatus Peregrinibacteria bacterium]
MTQNPNSNQIEAIELKLKTAYSQNRFAEVKTLAADLQKLDPVNVTAKRFLERVADKEKAAIRAANAEKINKLQDDMTQAFKAARFDEVERLSAELLKMDPGNKVVAKTKAKIEAAKHALKKKQEEALKPKKPSLWSRLQAYWATQAAAKKSRQLKAKLSAPEASRQAMIAKPVVATPNVFQALAAKVDEKPVAPKPVLASAISIPAVTSAMTPKLAPVPASPLPMAVVKPVSAVAPTPKSTVISKEPNGNVFTKLFGKKEVIQPSQNKSIIETIVSKTAKPVNPSKAEQPQGETGMRLLNFANAFFQFAVAFMVITAGFFYAQNLDQENRIFSLVGKTNYASRLHQAATTIDEKKSEEEALNQEVKKYEKGYNNRYEELIKKVVEKRLNWPDILEKITEITDTVYERNELSQYIQYQSFSFDAEKGLVRVSGTLSDPLGKNLTKLEELQQAFRTYPRDPDNSNDTTPTYFYDVQELTSLRKAFDKRTGRYTSSFQLSFALQPAAPKTKR